MKIRNLNANEIELKPCRIAEDKSWAQMLCFKTSRADMQVLTESFGLSWKSSYQMIGDMLFCTISIWDPDTREWVSRMDCGDRENVKDQKKENEEDKAEETDSNRDKTYATSAFKRAATQFGIGASLYAAPKIYINLNGKDFYNGKLKQNRFLISKIEYGDNDRIIDLKISDNEGNERWAMNKGESAYNAPKKAEYKAKNYSKNYTKPQPKDNLTILTEFCAEKKMEEGINKYQLKKFYEWYKEMIESGEWSNKFMPERLWEPFLAKSFS